MKKKKNSLFIPDVMFDSVHDISPSYLAERGIRVAVLDIDNTLVTYGMPEPTKEILAWIEALRAGGISVAVASNNSQERVERFNRTLSAFVTYRSRKPSPKSVYAACRHFGVTPAQTAVIGDQIFTDVLCARRAGAFAILVTPLPYKENFFFKCKRLMEKPFIRAYRRKNDSDNGS